MDMPNSEQLYRLSREFERSYWPFVSALLDEAANTSDIQEGYDERFEREYENVPFRIYSEGNKVSVSMETTLGYADKSTNILDRAYRLILREVKDNTIENGDVIFYPAMGGDDRVGSEWRPNMVIGIDLSLPAETFSHLKNVYMINGKAEDTEGIKKGLGKEGLPLCGDVLVAKGMDIIVTPENPDLDEAGYSAYIKNSTRSVVEAYLKPKGVIVAMAEKDMVNLAHSGYKEARIVSKEFREALKCWNNALGDLPGPALGMWLASDVKGFRNR